MKILFLSELFHPHGGGAELATFLIAKQLSNASHEVRVITNRFKDECEKDEETGFVIIRKRLLDSKKSLKYSLLLKPYVLFQKWMKSNIDWADIVYVPRYWYSAIPIIKKHKKPVITHLHDHIANCPIALLYDSHESKICEGMYSSCSPRCIYSYERSKGNTPFVSVISSIVNSTIGRYMGWMIKKSDAIVCVTHNHKKLVSHNNPDLEGKIKVINNPLPTLPFIPLENKGFVYFGGPLPLKGFQTLVEAMNKVSNPDVRLRATGFRDLTIVKRESLDSRIKILDWVSGIDLDKVYKEAHAVIIPSISPEPASYIVYEAILRGRIVIASDIGGIPELLNGYEGCFLFKPGDRDQLAANIEAAQSLEIEDAREIIIRNREKLLSEDKNKRALESFEALMKEVTRGKSP